MGFSMTFLRLRGGELVDADRERLRRFLQERDLVIGDVDVGLADILDASGEPLRFDGYRTDLHLDPLHQEGPLSGGISHATLSPQECEFIFDLCAAAGFLVCNHQADPLFVVPVRNHDPAELTAVMDDPTVVFADSPMELRDALAGGFAAFVEYRDRVIGSPQPPTHEPER